MGTFSFIDSAIYMKGFLRGKAKKAKTFGDHDIIDHEPFKKLEPPPPPLLQQQHPVALAQV